MAKSLFKYTVGGSVLGAATSNATGITGESVFNYVKSNPLESALAVASIHPAIRVGKFAYKGAKTLLKAYKNRPVTLYRGVPNVGKESLSEIKKRVKINNINDKNRFLKGGGNLKKTYGSWFTTDKATAKQYAMYNPIDKKKRPVAGSLFKVKVDLKTLNKIKKEQPRHWSYARWMNDSSREFYGIVPASVRRQAKKL